MICLVFGCLYLQTLRTPKVHTDFYCLSLFLRSPMEGRFMDHVSLWSEVYVKRFFDSLVFLLLYLS